MEVTLYIFGDGKDDFIEDFECILRSNKTPLHKELFTSAYEALRSEINELSYQEKKEFPKFSSLQDLLFCRFSQGIHSVLRAALFCTYELSLYISFAINHQISNDRNSAICVQGFGLGALAAAAVATSSTVLDLLELSPRTIRTVFNAALKAHNVAKSIDCSASSESAACTIEVQSWTAKEAKFFVKTFNQQNERPDTSDVYITLESRDTITISGPRLSLHEFRASLPKNLEVQEYYVGSLFHNPRLFSENDIEIVKKSCFSGNRATSRRQISTLSTATGRFSRASSFEEEIENSLRDLFLNTISFDNILLGTSYLTGLYTSVLVRIIDFGGNFGDRLREDLESPSMFSNLWKVQLEKLPSKTQQSTTLPSSRYSTSTTSFENPSGKPKIAIVGLSGRFPEAENLDEFWKILSQGLDVHSVTPSSRWNVESHVDLTGKRKNTSRVPHGCWLNNPGYFDTEFFGMSPREAAQVDPASRLALTTAYEAMEQAGMVPDRTPSTSKDRVGVLYGVTSNDWMEVNSAQNIDTHFIPGGCRAFIPGRINYFFKFSGLSSSIDTACSSSLSAIHTACNALWQRDIDTAIVGGTNVLTNPDYTSGLDRGHFLSRTGNCKSFDQEADGYCRGEAVCTLILKRYEDAVIDNDPIKGVILGTYTNHSAEAESITRPQISAQKDIFTRIISDTGVHPFDVSYVEMHGTGTQAGDLCEMTSVTSVLSPANPRYCRDKHQPLHVGSVKSNFGHGEAAAGATSLAKVLLMMRHDTIPPHCGIKGQINQRFPNDLDARQVHIAREAKAWISTSGITRKAFINNFSAAGGNSALLVEEAPHQTPKNPDRMRKSHVIAISARSVLSLKRNVDALSLYLQRNIDNVDIANLSYTTTARRTHHPFRTAICSSNVTETLAELRDLRLDTQLKKIKKPRTVFAFVGSGFYHLGIGKQLYNQFETFRKTLRLLDSIVKAHEFPSVLDHYISVVDATCDPDVITEHLGIVCLEIAYARLIISWGISPDVVIGHSLGEYTALNLAGVLSDADTLFIVGKRAQLLDQLGKRNYGGMLAVMASEEVIRSHSPDHELEVACYNSPEDTVLSGTKEQINLAYEKLRQKGLRVKILKVPYAFHSSHMDPIMDDLVKWAQNINFTKPSIPVICPLLSSTISEKTTFTSEYLSKHLRLPVNFFKSILNARDNGHLIDNQCVFIEIGPQTGIAGCIKRTLSPSVRVCVPPRLDQDIWHWTAKTLRDLYILGYDIAWNEYHRPFEVSLDVLELPPYSWNLKDYWIQYANDWSLRKGDPPLNVSNSQTHTDNTLLGKATESVTPAISLEDSIIQKVLVEKMNEEGLSLHIQLDLLHPKIKSSSQGHKVANIPLVTPSFYTDIAMRVGDYYARCYRPDLSEEILSVDHMVIESALVVPNRDGPQFLYVDALIKAKSACMKFYTTKSSSEHKTQHAKCEIAFKDRAKISMTDNEKEREALKNIKRLREECAVGHSFRFSNAMIYKMVGSLAQFDTPYRQLSEIVLNGDCLDAFSVVKTQLNKDNPSISSSIDALSQAAGFVMNGNDKVDLQQEVFVNHGWSSFYLSRPLTAGKSYTSYVRLSEQPNKRWEGDIIVLESNSMAAYFRGITLQKVPRRLLERLLSVAAKSFDSKAAVSDSYSAVMAESNEKSASHLSKTSNFPVPASGSPPPPCYSPEYPKYSLVAEKAQPLDVRPDLNFECPKKVENLESFVNRCHPSAVQSCSESTKIFKDVLRILAEETGASLDEFTEDATLVDLGIDSLLSLTLASRFEDELQLDSLSKISLYTDYQTIGELKKHIQDLTRATLSTENKNYAESIKFQTTEASNNPDSMDTPSSCTDSTIQVLDIPSRCPPATSTVLQGRFNSEADTLFIFPDGGGSAASYAQITRISPSLCVIGLNSPFYKEPKGMPFVSLDNLMNVYLEELRRRRPHGPYHLAGWSSGGILAYRAAQQLIREGDDVLSLALIDAPPPVGLDRLPQRWYSHCQSTGIFDFPGTAGKQRTFEHFEATIDVLENYIAEPLPPGFCPKVSIAWADECVFDGVRYPKFPSRDDDPQGIKFLTEKRKDMTAGYWQSLFPGEKIFVEIFDKTDHFSMIRGESGEKMAQFLRKALL